MAQFLIISHSPIIPCRTWKLLIWIASPRHPLRGQVWRTQFELGWRSDGVISSRPAHMIVRMHDIPFQATVLQVLRILSKLTKTSSRALHWFRHMFLCTACCFEFCVGLVLCFVVCLLFLGSCLLFAVWTTQVLN